MRREGGRLGRPCLSLSDTLSKSESTRHEQARGSIPLLFTFPIPGTPAHPYFSPTRTYKIRISYRLVLVVLDRVETPTLARRHGRPRPAVRRIRRVKDV